MQEHQRPGEQSLLARVAALEQEKREAVLWCGTGIFPAGYSYFGRQGSRGSLNKAKSHQSRD